MSRAALLSALLMCASVCSAQNFSQRGFLEATGFFFPNHTQ